jgi:hypothetical protein
MTVAATHFLALRGEQDKLLMFTSVHDGKSQVFEAVSKMPI